MEMEAICNNNDRTRWMMAAGFVAVMYVFWRYAFPCALAYQEQMQLFLWNGDYLMDRISEPGGVARYLAEMLVQCYNNLPMGALLLALLMGGLQQLTWLLMQHWGCQNGMRNYLLSFLTPIIIWALMGDKDVMTTVPVALLITLGLLMLMPKNVFSSLAQMAVCLILLLTVGYWMVGPLAIWVAVCLAVYDLVKQKEKMRWSMALLAVVVGGLFVQLASAQWLPYPKSRVLRGIDYLREPTVFINICMKSDLFYQLGLVNASRRYAFEFKQLIANGNQSGRMLKRLAETELVSGHEQLARKYLYILHDATFYRQWSETMLPLTRSPKLLESHPLYGPLSHSFPEKDVMY